MGPYLPFSQTIYTVGEPYLIFSLVRALQSCLAFSLGFQYGTGKAAREAGLSQVVPPLAVMVIDTCLEVAARLFIAQGASPSQTQRPCSICLVDWVHCCAQVLSNRTHKMRPNTLCSALAAVVDECAFLCISAHHYGNLMKVTASLALMALRGTVCSCTGVLSPRISMNQALQSASNCSRQCPCNSSGKEEIGSLCLAVMLMPQVAPIPEDIQDRRVEITGPVDRKMVINALNSGANVFMADFEDSNAPTW